MPDCLCRVSFATKSRSRRKTEQMYKVFGPQFLGRDNPDFSTADYYRDLLSTVWQSLVEFRFWSPSAKPGNEVESRWHTRTWHRSILLPILHLTPPTQRFPLDDLRKILHGGERMAKVWNSEEILPKVSAPWVERTKVPDFRRICDSKDRNITSCSGKNLSELLCRNVCYGAPRCNYILVTFDLEYWPWELFFVFYCFTGGVRKGIWLNLSSVILVFDGSDHGLCSTRDTRLIDFGVIVSFMSYRRAMSVANEGVLIACYRYFDDVIQFMLIRSVTKQKEMFDVNEM